MILKKVTDDLLFGADSDTMNYFVEQIERRFKIRKRIIDGRIIFNGCTITQNQQGDTSMDMKEYMSSIKSLDVTRARRKQVTEKATENEYKAYRSLAGSIIWEGNGTIPQSSYVGSYLKETAPRLRIQDLTEANKILKELKDPQPVILFQKTSAPATNVEAWTFSDVSFDITYGREYGQTG